MERPIFIVGCPRSGTTLLQLMLHAHPRIAIPPETRFLLPAYYRRAEWGDLDEPAHRQRLAEWIVTTRGHKFDDLGLDPAATIAEMAAAPPTLGSMLGTVLRAYAASHGKPRWGDKRPTYIRYLPDLIRMFPDAQFVHLIRDGRDCVGSLKQMSWWKYDTAYAINTWARAIDNGHEAGRRMPPGSYYELQYEHLVADPAAELQALCAFLDEAYDPSMLRPHELASVTPRRKTHHARTQGEIDAAAVRSWESRLTGAEIRLAEHVLGDRLETYGYDLTGPGRPPAKDLAHYYRTAAEAKQDDFRRRARDGWRRIVTEEDVACRLSTDPTLMPS
ncbi:sulfotransferase [Actinocorallia longicatena]|uniref:Sulfotransferase n=1 Tax=Actinocorallia longicatena TaxID=111803 RepID=A0ABP6QBX3_9ACTN